MQKSKKIKVAMFSFGILEQGGGYEDFIMNSSTGLNKNFKNIEVEIVTMNNKITNRLQYLLSIYHIKDHSKKEMQRESLASIEKKIINTKYYKARNFNDLRKKLSGKDIVHTKNEVLELATLSYLGFSKLPKIVMGIHTPIIFSGKTIRNKIRNSIYHVVYKNSLKNISAIYTQNKDDYELLKNKYLYNKSLGLVNQGIPMNLLHLRNKADNLHILFVGRLTYDKGIDIFIECFKFLSESTNFNSLSFIVSGAGNKKYVNELEKLSREYSNFNYVGHTAHEDINKLYDWADVLVVTSRQETLCKVIIEAASRGKITIASNIPGPRDTIINNSTGYLLEVNAKNFSNKIESLLKIKINESKKIELMSKRAMTYISRKYDPKSAQRKIYGLYKEVLEQE